MTTLDELLSPEPTEDETKRAEKCHEEQGCCDEVWTAEEYDKHTREIAMWDATIRLALVRATLQEAAKLVCPLCDIGYPLVLGLNDGETGSQYEHENRGYNQGRCLADKIHARLAKEKP